MENKVGLLIYCDEYTGLSRVKYISFDAIDLDSFLKSFGYTTSIVSNFCERAGEFDHP